jgi:fructosamine-3-kinase
MSRADIYYWKCDRPAAFHGTRQAADAHDKLEPALAQALRQHFGTDAVQLSPAAGQGTHLTWLAQVQERQLFLRVEHGPEQDGQLAIESVLLDQVRALGVPTPEVHGWDVSRSVVPFAWQALERIPFPDLNYWQKQGLLQQDTIAHAIGSAVGQWQALSYAGYGPLRADLQGCHARYADYFHLRLEQHLHYLTQQGFLTTVQADEMRTDIQQHEALLQLGKGCLVHKDLALWNVLGSPQHVAAFIDLDDAICGDAMDDLSLLGCFHDGDFIRHALEGYQTQRALPADYRRRFWLHLLRNMIVKSVIRVGAGYFQRTEGFFLIGSGSSGAALRDFTLTRLELALQGLRRDADPTTSL